jgi:septum site-determining protein MinD
MSDISGKVLGVISVKGGVGKTSTVSNLGVVFSREHGISCVLVDANISVPNLGLHMDMANVDKTLQEVLEKEEGSLADAVHVHESGVHVIPASMSQAVMMPGSIERKIGTLTSKYELVLMDSSPGTGNEPLEVIRCSDAVIIVACLDFPSISAALKSIRLSEEMGKTVLGVVLNRLKGEELDIEDVKNILSSKILGTIPEDSKVREAVSNRMPVVLFAPRSPASAAYRKLAEALLETDELKGLKR